jgi:hypothetical protein
MRTIIFSITILLTSCVKYHITSDKGIRVQNSKVFKYKKPRYTKLDKSFIDTNAIDKRIFVSIFLKITTL